MAQITLHCTVKISQKRHWVCLFSQELLGSAYYKRQGDGPLPVKIVHARPHISMPFICFIYAEEQNEQGQTYVTHVGCACVLLADAEMARPQPIRDITGEKVGTMQIALKADAEGQAVDGLSVCITKDEKYTPVTDLSMKSKVDTLLDAIAERWDDETNIPAPLPRFIFKEVAQHFGKVPMWAFTALNLRTTAAPDRKYLEQALYNAKYMLMVEKIDFKDRKLVGELLNEMQTLPVRAQLYVMDHSKGKMVDDWINPLLCPVQNLAGIDCEDAAQRMLQESAWLCMEDGNDELGQLAQIDRTQYISFLSGMTLRLPNGSWVYHAAGLKLDRSFVLSKLGILKEPSKSLWPAVLLEGTAYTTGCWQYTSVLGAERADKLTDSSAVTFAGGVDAICKVTPRIMAKKDLYGPIQSLFSVELAEKYGIVQIELAEDKKRAATVRSIMNYSDAPEWIPVRCAGTKEEVEMLKRSQYPQCPIPTVHPKAARPKIRVRSSATVDFCVRKADWNLQRQKELEASKGIHVNAVTLSLAADLELVHVTDESPQVSFPRD